MFNALYNIDAYNTISPPFEIPSLKFSFSLYQNLIFCIVETPLDDSQDFNFDKIFLPLSFISRKIDNSVIFLFNFDDSLKDNFKQIIICIQKIAALYNTKIFAGSIRMIFEDEYIENIFYHILNSFKLPEASNKIIFSEQLYLLLKRYFSFKKEICNNVNYYFLNMTKVISAEFFGREQELKVLRKNFSLLKSEFSSSNQVTIHIKGEPGIGKTSLVKYFFKSGNSKNTFFLENPVSGNAYGHFVELLQIILKNQNNPARYLKEFASCIKDGKLRNNLTSSIPDLVGILGKAKPDRNSTEKNQNQILALRNFICAYAYYCSQLKSPLIIAFDDIQWADSSTAKAINFILEDFQNDYERNYQIQFIFIYRSGYKIEIKDQLGDPVEIQLDSLEEEAASKYLISLLKQYSINLSVRKQEVLLKKSGRNPLFIQEIVEYVKNNNWNIPESVKEIIKFRLNALPEKSAAFLKVASVIDREINLALVNAVLKGFDSEEVNFSDIESLVENNFITQNPDSIQFKHDLIKESIYESINITEKKTIHNLAALETENLCKDRIENYYYQLAEHFTKAENKEKMIVYLEKAGDKAKILDDNKLAEKYYEKLFCLINYCENLQSLSNYCETLIVLGDLEKVYDILDYSIRQIKVKNQFFCKLLICKARLNYQRSNFNVSKNLFCKLYKNQLHLLDTTLKVETLKGVFDSYIQLNTYNKIFPLINEIQKSLDNKNYLIQNLINEYKGRIYFKSGQYIEALDSYKKVLDIASALGQKRVIGNIQIKLGGIYFVLGNFIEANNYFQNAIKVNKQIGNYRNLSICFGNLANLYINAGNVSSAYNHLKIQQKIIIRLDDKFSLAINYNAFGNFYLRNENYLEAEKYFVKTLLIVKEANLKQLFSPVFSNLGLISMILGDFEKSIYYFFKQEKVDKAFANIEARIKWNYNLSYIYRRIKKINLSIKYDSQAIDLARKINNNLLIVSGTLNMALNFFLKNNFLEATRYAIMVVDTYNSKKMEKDDPYYESTFYIQLFDILLKENHFSKEEVYDKIKVMKKTINKITDFETKCELNFHILKIYKSKKICSVERINSLASSLLKIYSKNYDKTKKYNYKFKIYQIKNYLLN